MRLPPDATRSDEGGGAEAPEELPFLTVAELLVERDAPTPITVVCALAAPEGLQRLRDEGLDLHVYTAAIDDHLNDNAYIVPGLGDAGDRQFGSGV